MIKTRTGILSFALLVAAHLVSAQSVEDVRLNMGRTAKVAGSIKGNQYRDYRVQLGAGQTVAIRLGGGSQAYFNLNQPSSNLALYNGSMDGSNMPARLIPSAGKYVVRVYQMGAAADEGRTSRYALDISVRGKALKPLSGATDAKVEGTSYHAKADVPCRLELDKKRTTCRAFVTRYEGGSATVELRASTNVRRVLFMKGKPAAHDSMEAFTYSRSGDSTVVRFGDGPSEEYTIPDALVDGG